MRVLIGIMSCWGSEEAGDNQSIRDTWIAELKAYSHVDYKFFHGQGPTNYPGGCLYRFSDGPRPENQKPDIITLQAPDSYENLILKSQEMHYWAYRNGYDFMFKADSDTYVNIPQLLASGFEKHDYFGHVHTAPGSMRDEGVNEHGFLGGGEGYWTSKYACEVISKAIPTKRPQDNFGSAEDLWMGEVLGNAHIKMVDHPEYGHGITLHGSLIAGPRGQYDNKWMREIYVKRQQRP